jgi:hypothetical protein
MAARRSGIGDSGNRQRCRIMTIRTSMLTGLCCGSGLTLSTSLVLVHLTLSPDVICITTAVVLPILQLNGLIGDCD